VRDAAVDAGDCVLEVGTGTGILTDALADRAGRVVTCDVDARLQEIARGLREWPETVTFLPVDVLAGKHALNPDVLAAWECPGLRRRIVSNLPYAIATPFLANMLAEPWHDAVLLVQREAAERFVARPGTAEYGPIAVLLAAAHEVEVLRQVGPQVFWPRPRVHSTLIRVAAAAPGPHPELRELEKLLHEGFRHRRKTLRKVLPAARLEAAGIDPGARPQDVAPDQWRRLLTVPPA
jgi:16S rRNA (adenine1518-N6/adenine1519-N6)-dimethyltransferase